MIYSFFILDEFPDVKFWWYHRLPRREWGILREYVYNRDDGRCRYCGVEVLLDGCHIHHTLPLGEHGTNHPSNLKTLCLKCHENRHPFMKSDYERLV